jgi:hypothetical protein
MANSFQYPKQNKAGQTVKITKGTSPNKGSGCNTCGSKKSK